MDINTIDTAVKCFYIDSQRYPKSLDELLMPPDDVEPAKWQGPYLTKGVPPDPWGNAYRYQLTGDRYRIWSKGPDAIEGNADDILSDHVWD